MSPRNPKDWSGADVRKLRESLGLTRKEFAEHLNLSAVAIEKWELSPRKKIRPKYLSILESLGKSRALGLGLAAPTLVAPAALGLWGLDLITNAGLRETIQKLEALQKLTEEERSTWIKLWSKMK